MVVVMVACVLSVAPNYGDNDFPVAPFTEQPTCGKELCIVWNCASTKLPATNDYLTCSEWACTKMNDRVCARWECLTVDVPGSDDQTCASFNCTESKDGRCVDWDCTDTDLPSTNDRDTCSEYRCERIIDGTCRVWRCTVAPFPVDIEAPPNRRPNSRQACSRFDCTVWDGDRCFSWTCTYSIGYQSCSKLDCVSRHGTSCDAWNCTEMDVPGHGGYEACATWECGAWDRITLNTTCSGCTEHNHCESGCCLLGECIDKVADPDKDRSTCICSGGTWKDEKCCGDDPGESWCSSEGACISANWVPGTDSEFYCSQCKKGSWNEDRCCVDDESWCGRWGRCLYGTWLPLCKQCYSCKNGVCIYTCKPTVQNGDKKPDDCISLGGIWRDGKCCGDDKDADGYGESWIGTTGECRGGFWFELSDNQLKGRLEEERDKEEASRKFSVPESVLVLLVVVGCGSFLYFFNKRSDDAEPPPEPGLLPTLEDEGTPSEEAAIDDEDIIDMDEFEEEFGDGAGGEDQELEKEGQPESEEGERDLSTDEMLGEFESEVTEDEDELLKDVDELEEGEKPEGKAPSSAEEDAATKDPDEDLFADLGFDGYGNEGGRPSPRATRGYTDPRVSELQAKLDKLDTQLAKGKLSPELHNKMRERAEKELSDLS
ncbi:MAG: hypothetical protein QGG26_08790 [Candidatus Undinarchaeales archaeon]|nr:hypothetical protein [Candidatus Undinarchaeales archaeon]